MYMLFFLLLSLLFVLVVMFVISSSFLGFLATRVPFVPTHRADIPELVQRLGLTKQDVIYDLGSGNGKVVFLFEHHSGAKVIGIEAMLWTHLWAKLRARFTRSKATFRYGNFFNHPLHDATVVYTYLYPPLMSKLAGKLQTECRPGTLFVSRDFYNEHLRQIDHYNTASGHEMYVYQV